MQILHGLEGLSRVPQGAAASIGNFDGVHLGHQRILKTARQLADQSEARALVVVTFEPHPSTVLRPRQAPPRLTPPAIKQPLLESAGADYLVVLPPEPQVLNLTAEQFWHILRDQMRVSHLVEGSTFRFGKGAAGNVQLLREWSAGSNFHLHVVDSVEVALLDMRFAAVHSSLIRFLLEFGRVRDAAIGLGRPYSLSGTVGRGAARGRKIGFPTANLQTGDQMLPAQAVYAGRCRIDDRIYPAAVSIGTNPTFGDHTIQVEAHLLGFDGDLYDRQIDLELLDWVRDQRKFPNVQSLKSQIEKDIARCVEWVDRDPSRPITCEYMPTPQVTASVQTP
ncbi:MAG: riboflavin biosynthesis protein RibF [Tepidisphaeraceae bacterium]|jgi:riboflavin kinase/FMN adenylyltransferase